MPVSLQIGSFSINKTLIHWINDGLWRCFCISGNGSQKENYLKARFLPYQQAIFPAIAAIGGMVIPAVVYWFIAKQDPSLANGLALNGNRHCFALGIMALLSKQAPLPLKIFLLALYY